MPKRQLARQRINSSEVMGEDSYVIVEFPTANESQANARMLDNLQTNIKIAEDRYRDEPTRENKIRLDNAQDELNKATMQMIADYLVEWNWVDFDDNPLEQPYKNPDILGELVASEIRWLSNIFAGVSSKKS